MKHVTRILLVAALIAVALATALTLPASAERRSVTVQMADGSLQAFEVDVAPEATLEDIATLVPGEPVSWVTLEETPAPPAEAPAPEPAPEPTPEPAPAPAPAPEQPAAPPTGPAPAPAPPVEDDDEVDGRLDATPRRGVRQRDLARRPQPQLQLEGQTYDRVDRENVPPRPAPLRRTDGSPAPSNPGFVEALPGPSFATGVPNFVIRKFRVPPFLLPIYQAAGIEYGIRWEILAAINEIETDYGRNLNVSSAGALGWMQFIPSSWRAYGVDANKDGQKDPYNPVDAIFAAARYLKAADYESDVRGAIFAYNHADWYVDSVLLRARLIAGVPADLIGSLTGLTEGRFPVAAKARYADDLAEAEALRRVRAGQNAANVIESDDSRRGIEIFARKGAPVVATNDGVIKRLGPRRIVLQDVYGNRYTYSGLGRVASHYPVPREEAAADTGAEILRANRRKDPSPATPASEGSQPRKPRNPRKPDKPRGGRKPGTDASRRGPGATKERLFANPDMKLARPHGGLEQLLNQRARRQGGFQTYEARLASPVRLDPDRFRLKRLRAGSRVIGGTVLGRVGAREQGKAPHLNFSIRPAGKGAPRIDPKPILDGWKLLEATAIYRASGRNVLYGADGSDGFSIGQILLLPKPLLERRVLSDERIEIYDCGRDDIRSGQVDRRVLAALAYLSESGLRPTVTSLKCGHGFYTSSGNVSHHSSGNAVDIAQVNGVPVLGHQEPGGVTEQAVRRLMALQGTVQPDQIISLLDLGGATHAMADHADHIHVGFQPLFGANQRLGRQAQAVLEPGQWPELLERLDEIENPVVPTETSPYAIPAARRLREPGELE